MTSTVRTVTNSRLVDGAKLDNISVTQPVNLDIIESGLSTVESDLSSHIANLSNPHSVTKTQVGLWSVDNTSDATKNSATATLTNKTLTAPVINSPTGIVKWDVWLGNVDNTSDANKPVSSATQTALDWKVDENVSITGATKTKITYDAKGLVTAGADATTADIAASTNKNYVTDAQAVVIGNTSGTNTGDQNIFSTIAVSGQSNVVADTTSDTLTLVAGTNVTITTNATSDEITINASGGSGSWDVVASGTLTDNTVILWGGTTTVKSSSKTIVTTLWTDDTTLPTSKAVKDVTDAKVTWNVAITWATKTKITYDAKWLVTSWSDATTADIADSTNKRYVTDANLTVIGNTSNTNTGDETETTLLSKLTLFNDSKDPTWFVDPDNLVITGDTATRKITITHSSGFIDYYFHWKKYTLTSPWTSDAHWATTTNLYYLVSTDWVNFTWNTTWWNFYDIMVAEWLYLGSAWNYAKSSHWLMQWQSHKHFHETVGSQLTAWGDLSNYTLNNTTLKYPNTSATTITDEDVQTILTTDTSWVYAQQYLSWTATNNFVVWASTIVPVSWNQPYYNQWNGSAFVQTLLPNNAYMALWQVAIPMASDDNSKRFRYVWIQGQEQGTLTVIQWRTTNWLNLWALINSFDDFVFLNKVIIRYASSNWSITSVEKLTGTRISQTSTTAWAYLSTVNVDWTTITWDGTSVNPLVASWVFSTISATGTSSLTLGTASSLAGSIIFKNATNANTLTIQSGVTGATIAYTLPATAPTDGQVLSSLANGTMSWVTSGWLAWNATITWTAWTGLWITVSDSASAGAIGQSITIGNTQTQVVTWLKIDTWTSAVNHKAVDIIILQSGTSTGQWAVNINNFWSATQSVWAGKSLVLWYNFNTNSANSWKHLEVQNYNNAGAWYNTGIIIINASTEITGLWTTTPQWVGLSVYQTWVWWTAIAVEGIDSVNSSTNGLVNYTLSNTQSGATVMQKIDLGTSAQGHTGLLVNAKWNSASQTWINIDLWSTWAGTGLLITATANTSTPHYLIRFDWGNSSAWYAGAFIGMNALETLNTATNTSIIDLNPDFTATAVNIAARTTTLFNFGSRTRINRTQTVTRNYDEVYFSRTTSTINAGAVLTNQGSVLKLENVATQTAGTLTDTVSVLTLAQWVTTTWNLITGTKAWSAVFTVTSTGAIISGWLWTGTLWGTGLSGRIVWDVDTWSSTTVDFALRRSENTTATLGTKIYYGRQRGTLASPTVITTGDAIFDEYGYAYDWTDYAISTAISSFCEGTIAANQVPWVLTLSTANASGTLTERLRINSLWNVILWNQAALATNATDWFVYIPTCAWTPTGVPTAYTGKVAMVMDTTNHKLYAYDWSWVIMN